MKDLGNARLQRVKSTYSCVLVYMYTYIYIYVCAVGNIDSTRCEPGAVDVTHGSGDQSRPCAVTTQAGSVSTEH